MAKSQRNRVFIPDLVIADARISGRPNFSGEERVRNGQIVNGEGNRNFCINIPEDGVMLDDGNNTWASVDDLIRMGWPIKPHYKENDEDPTVYYLPIQVKFSVRPPEIYLIIDDQRHQITEQEIDTFDGRTFSKIKLIVHPSIRPNRRTGESQVTAYLDEGWFYLRMSPFAKEWYEANANNIDTPF